MFAVGVTVLRQEGSQAGSSSSEEQQRHCLAHLRACFSNRELERALLSSLPDVEDMPPPMLPPSWEQRLDEKNGRIYFIDHAACMTTWVDPREEAASQARRFSSAVDELEEDADDADADEAAGAADDLASLCIGVATGGEEGFQRWVHAVEHSALASVSRLISARRDEADALQWPRYMLLQRIHHAVVHRLLAPPPALIDIRRLWPIRNQAVGAASSAAASPLSRENLNQISRHCNGGLTRTYTPRLFAQPKLNLRKVHKVLAAALAAATAPAPPVPPPLPDSLRSQLCSLLSEKGEAGVGEDPVWALAAETCLLLGLVSGSTATLLHLPQAVYERRLTHVLLPLAPPLFALHQRCSTSPRDRPHLSSWRGFEYWMREARCVVWASAPAEAAPVAAEEAALNVLIGCATRASTVWERLAAREGVSLPVVDQGSCGVQLSQVAAAAGAVAEMGVRVSRVPEDVEVSRAWLTPQQGTEMWQPGAIELGPVTLPALIGLLGALRTAGEARRVHVAVLCTLRLLMVHLLLFDRCALHAAAALDEPGPNPNPSSKPNPNPAPLRRQLLDALVELALAPFPGAPPDLAEAIQSEAVLTLTAGIRAIFPWHVAQLAMLHACVVRAEAASPAGAGLEALVAALCAAVGAQSHVSRLVVLAEDDVPTEVLCAMLPGALHPAQTPFDAIQSALRAWLMRSVVAEAAAALAEDAPLGADERSPCMRLLASLVQELVARASLCAHHRDPPNAALAGIAEELLRAATALLKESLAPARSAAALDAQQARLAPTFIGSMLPWLVDSLALFSAFAFEHAQRLLPLVLPLLHTLRAALAPGRGSVGAAASRAPPELAQHTLLQSAHPYKPTEEPDKKGGRRAQPAATHEEEGAWPGATQLQLRFDSQCCTEEGDWLTLYFYRQGQPVPGRTLRLGGPWANWPKTPFTVPADAVRATFVYSPFSSQPHERWGYSIAVTASRRDKTCELTTPPLHQLRVSLAYLGAKCAALLVAAEPVVDEEKENRHWLQSPLFARGLPLQLPADHSLMHPFFGIQPSTPTRGSAALAFLDDLVGLGGGPATLLHRRMSGEQEAAEHGHAAAAQRALLASLLSHNRLLHTARRAARQLAAEQGHGRLGVETGHGAAAQLGVEEDHGAARQVGAEDGTGVGGRAASGDGGSQSTTGGDQPAAGRESVAAGRESVADGGDPPKAWEGQAAAGAGGGGDASAVGKEAAAAGEEQAAAGEESAAAVRDQPAEGVVADGSPAQVGDGEEAAGGAAGEGSACGVKLAGEDGAGLPEANRLSEDSVGAGDPPGAAGQPPGRPFFPPSWVGTVLPEADSVVGAEEDATLALPVSAAEWARLRAQWRSARSLFVELCEAHARTLNDEAREADQGVGLHGLMSFVLLVAKQNATASADDGTGGADELAAMAGPQVRELLARMAAGEPRGDEEGGGPRLADEIATWVASRVAPQLLIQSMKRQQCRAYSRAAGFRALCELLRAIGDSPPLQCKLLSTLDSVLQPAGAGATEMTSHYSRDCTCAGPHAKGRLRIGFAALVEQLVLLAAADDGAPPSTPQLLALKCLLHCELRQEDLPILEATRLVPVLHARARDGHATVWSRHPPTAPATPLDSPPPQRPSERPSRDSPALTRESTAADTPAEPRHLPQALQTLFHAFVSRLFATIHGRRPPKVDGAPAAAAPMLFRLKQPSRPDILSTQTLPRPPTPTEEEVVGALLEDVDRAAARMREELLSAGGSVVGADTSGEGWGMAERVMHSTLALLFQLVTCSPGLAVAVGRRSDWLKPLLRSTHVGSLRCVRLALRSLRQVLPHSPPHSLHPTLWAGSLTDPDAPPAAPDLGSFLLALIGDALAGEVAEAAPTLAASRALWRNGHVAAAMASEAVALARHLLLCDTWSASLASAVREALLAAPGVVRALQAEASGGPALRETAMLGPALSAVGAFCVVGGRVPTLFVGCRVSVAPDGSGAAEQGVLARWDGAHDSEASVLLDADLADLRTVEMSALRLQPVEDPPLPPSCFTLTPELVSTFELFLPKRTEAEATITQPTALQASFLFGLLQSRALKALRGLLQHMPAMRCVLRCGLFPSIMASAATPVPLVGSHTTDGLQAHIAALEHIHTEAAAAARAARTFARAAAVARRAQERGLRLVPPEREPLPGSLVEGGSVRLGKQLSQLAEMGFEYTLCQKAVGLFGEDMEAATQWLTSEQATETKLRTLHRSPSWQLAASLAQAIGMFSVSACKKALDRNGNDSNAAAAWLLEHGAYAEAEVEADAEVSEANVSTEAAPDDDVMPETSVGTLMPTAAFSPEAQSGFQLQSPRGAGQPSQLDDDAKVEDNLAEHWTLSDEFEGFNPPDPAAHDGLQPSKALAHVAVPRARSRASLAETPVDHLRPVDCVVGRLVRPVPLSANRNCVICGRLEWDDERVLLYTRHPETDGLQTLRRRVAQCQRAEASLVPYLPELEHLGADSSGLSAVSGAAHTMFAILLLRQAALYLLSDMQGLKSAHEDKASAFDLEQLGRPRELLDLLKLAYHSSGGGGSDGSMAFSRLWAMLEGLVRGGADAPELPGPFKVLPLLLRDDALAHLRREKDGIATLQSPHPLQGTRMLSRHRLTVEGAAHLRVVLDRRSELSGSAEIAISTDELGRDVVGRWPQPGTPWTDVQVPGDTVWCHLSGEVQSGRSARPLWGFRLRACAVDWRSPEGEAQVLETPLAFAWQLLELLSEHRPHELLTHHTAVRLIQYLHARCAPRLTNAASLLLRLFQLPAADAAKLDGADPRLGWPLRHVVSLASHVDALFAADRGARAPLRLQLLAELVARAASRLCEPPLAASTWLQGVSELCMFVEFVRRDAACDPLTHLPTPWLQQLEGTGVELLLLSEHWTLQRYAALIAYATARIGGPRGELVDVSPRSLPAPSAEDVPLAAAGVASLQAHLALLQIFNRVLLPVFGLAWTGNPALAHTLGAQLTVLRQLIFIEVKQAVWGAALDAAAPPRRPADITVNPPPTVTVNRRRALKERLDRRTRTKNSVFVQLHNQIRAIDRRELMRRERAFKVKFAGEAADDHGGPYREVFTVLASELHREDVLPLLLLCPNGQHNLGSNRDRFLLNPGSSSAEQLAFFEFLGMVLGFALLQKETVVTLSLCSVVWKQLVHEPLDVQDLAGFDEMMAQSLAKLEDIHLEGVGPDDFGELIFESFTTMLSHGVQAPVCEGGADIEVTFENRRRYCELVRRVRLEEGRLQAQVVLKGINAMVPASLLPLFTHREIELMVCGAPDIDVAVLRQHTRYGVTVDPMAPHIQILWQVLEQFTSQQRTLFLSFIWSRTRLPATEEDWSGQSMKLHTLECSDPDGHLPVSHTCFFSMEWPRYSSVDVAKGKLLYAITNCTDIDADHTAEGRANMAMSAEEEL